MVFVNTVPGREHSGKVKKKNTSATSFLRNHLNALKYHLHVPVLVY